MVTVATAGAGGDPKRVLEQLDAVEVALTFLRPEPADRLAQRLGGPRDGLELSLQAWQWITHPGDGRTYDRAPLPDDVPPKGVGGFQLTPWVEHATETMLELVRALDAQWLLFQTPPTFRPTKANVEEIETYFTSRDWPCRLAWEPRGLWPFDILQELEADLPLTVVTDPFSMPPLGEDGYHRLHGTPPGPKAWHHVYSDKELERLAHWTRDGDPWVVFDNEAKVDDAIRFRRHLGQLPSP